MAGCEIGSSKNPADRARGWPRARWRLETTGPVAGDPAAMLMDPREAGPRWRGAKPGASIPSDSMQALEIEETGLARRCFDQEAGKASPVRMAARWTRSFTAFGRAIEDASKFESRIDFAAAAKVRSMAASRPWEERGPEHGLSSMAIS